MQDSADTAASRMAVPVTVTIDRMALLNLRDSIKRLRDAADKTDESTVFGHLQAELDRTAAQHREMALEQLGLLTDPPTVQHNDGDET